MTSRLASEAMIPNPRLAAFEPFIGTWTTIGGHSMIPGVTLHGRTAFEWHEGGAFVRVSSEIDEPKIPIATAIIGAALHTSEASGRAYMSEALYRRECRDDHHRLHIHQLCRHENGREAERCIIAMQPESHAMPPRCPNVR